MQLNVDACGSGSGPVSRPPYSKILVIFSAIYQPFSYSFLRRNAGKYVNQSKNERPWIRIWILNTGYNIFFWYLLCGDVDIPLFVGTITSFSWAIWKLFHFSMQCCGSGSVRICIIFQDPGLSPGWQGSGSVSYSNGKTKLTGRENLTKNTYLLYLLCGSSWT
jgi:hypothetical protein